MRHYPQKVENYTNAFLVTAGLTLFMAFFTLAAVKGIVWVMLAAALIDTFIRAGEARLRTSKVGEDN